MVPLRPPRKRPRSVLVGLLVSLLALVAFGPGALGHDERQGATFSVTHGPVTTTLVGETSDGHQPGDMRVTSLPIDGEDGQPAGRLDAVLLTTSVDEPIVGDETRVTTLVFVLGDGTDQLVVTGSAFYPAGGSTIAVSTSVIRAVVGGSGAWAGASGWAETEHLDDGTWRHTFHVTHPAAPEALDAPAASSGIVRTLLGDVEPSISEGHTLALWNYSIPAGQALVPHVHPGYQVARIVSGTLTYDVISGEALVIRADGSQETAGGGQVVTLKAGDTVVENPGVTHFGANNGDVPVEIYTATLFSTGSPPAVPVETMAPAASPAP
jgi:quercetin dioxygenase-like cupin family protein